MQVFLFHSYKGGSGKTILSINFANLLVSKFNKRVLLIEADFAMPSFRKIFTDHTPNSYFNDYLNQTTSGLDQYIYPSQEANLGIVYCNEQFSSKDKVHGTDQQWFLNKIEQIRTDISKLNYDYVVFDLSPGFHFFTISALMLTNQVMVILRPDFYSFISTKDLVTKIYSKAVLKTRLKIHMLFNQVPNYDKMLSLVDQWIEQTKIEFPFFASIEKFRFHNETMYRSAIREVILPENDPLNLELKNLIENIIEV